MIERREVNVTLAVIDRLVRGFGMSLVELFMELEQRSDAPKKSDLRDGFYPRYPRCGEPVV